MLDLGELRASVVVDRSGVAPGLARVEREVADFTRKLDRQTTDAGEQAGRNLGDGVARGGLTRLRSHVREFAAVGREFGRGMGDGVAEAFPQGLRSVGARLKTWGRQQLDQAKSVGRGIGGHLGDGVKAGVGMMGGALRTGGRLLAGFAVGGVASLSLVAGAAAAIGGSVASSNEQAMISFSTMLRKAGDDEATARKKAAAFIKDLQTLAATTPFEFADLQEYASALVSAGIETDKIIPMMRNLGDVTSGVGTGSEGIDRATVALQQMNAAQKISAEDLNQLRDAGIPVYDLLAGATGKSKAEIVDLAGKGKLGKKELDALLDTLSSDTPKGLEKFSGLMGKQSQSLKGMWSNLSDTVQQGLGRVGEKAMPQLKAGLAGVSGVLSTVFDYLDDHGDDLERIFGAGARTIRSFWNIVKPVLKAFTGSVGDGQDVLTALADWMDTHEGDMVGFFVGAGHAAIGFSKVAAVAVSTVLKMYVGLERAIQASLEFILSKTQAALSLAAVAAGVLGLDKQRDQLLGMTRAVQELRDNNQKNSSGAGVAQQIADGIDNKLLPSLNAAGNALDEYGKKAEDSARRGDAWRGALQAISRSVEANGTSLSEHSKKGRANRKVIEDSVEALNRDAQAAYDNAAKKGTLRDAEKAAAKVIRDGTGDIKDQAKKAGLNEDAVKDMITRLKKVPSKVSTDIKFSTNADKVLAKITSKSKKYDASYTAAQQNSGHGPTASARGGNVGRTLVGGLAGRFVGQLPGHTPLHKGDDLQLPILGGGRQWLRGGEGVQVTEAMDSYEQKRLDAMNHGVLSGLTPQRVRQQLGEQVDEHDRGPTGRAARGGRVGQSDVPASVLNVGPQAAASAQAAAKAAADAYARETRAALQRILNAQRAAASAGVIDVSNPTGRTTWRGGTFTNLFAANLRRAEGIAGRTIPVIQGGFRPATSYSGTSHAKDAIDTSVNYGSLRAMRAVGIATGDRTGLGNWAPHMHAVPTKGAGYAGGSAVWQAQDYMRRGGASQSPRSPWGLARGGTVPYSPLLADLASALRTGRGYAGGTSSAAAGFNWTAEKEAELVVSPQVRRYSGGEKVLNPEQTRAALNGRSAPLIDKIVFEGRSGTREELGDLQFAVRSLEVGGSRR